MNAVIAQPRPELSPYAPRIYSLQIAQQKIKDLIGPRGKTVQGIQEETNTTRTKCPAMQLNIEYRDGFEVRDNELLKKFLRTAGGQFRRGSIRVP